MGYLDLVDRLAILRTYRASHVLVDLGWVDLDLGSSPGWWATTVATYFSKQDGGTSQIQVNKTQSSRTWDALYILDNFSTSEFL